MPRPDKNPLIWLETSPRKRVLFVLPKWRWLTRALDIATGAPRALPAATGAAVSHEVASTLLPAARAALAALPEAATASELLMGLGGLAATPLLIGAPLALGIISTRWAGQQRRELAEQERRAAMWRTAQRRKLDSAAATLWRGAPLRTLESFSIPVRYNPDRDEVVIGDTSFTLRYKVGRVPGATFDRRTGRHYITNPGLFKRAVLRRLREAYEA